MAAVVVVSWVLILTVGVGGEVASELRRETLRLFLEPFRDDPRRMGASAAGTGRISWRRFIRTCIAPFSLSFVNSSVNIGLGN